MGEKQTAHLPYFDKTGRRVKQVSEAQVQINLFGGFEVLFQGEPALLSLQQSRKTDLFLEYLILKHGRPVPHEELLCALWSDRESRNPATALRTLLYRYRRLVETEGIAPLEGSVITTRGFYQWNTAADCVVDVYEFERLATEARELPVLDERRMALQRRMVELYRGPLLSSAAEQSWIVPKSVYYHDLYVECIYAMMSYWKAREAYDKIASLCRHVLEIERFDSRLQMELSYARQKLGKAGEEDASAPSTDNASLYQAIVRAEHSAETDISRIVNALDGEMQSGVFLCDRTVFAGVYRLQQCLLERTEMTAFLCLITLVDAEGEHALDARTFKAQMQQLTRIAGAQLRQGDVLSRYSDNQLVALLPAVSFETARLTVERIRRVYYEARGSANVMVTYKLRPLQAADR